MIIFKRNNKASYLILSKHIQTIAKLKKIIISNNKIQKHKYKLMKSVE